MSTQSTLCAVTEVIYEQKCQNQKRELGTDSHTKLRTEIMHIYIKKTGAMLVYMYKQPKQRLYIYIY